MIVRGSLVCAGILRRHLAPIVCVGGMLLLSGIAQASWELNPNEPADPFTAANCSSNIAAGDKNNGLVLTDPGQSSGGGTRYFTWLNGGLPMQAPRFTAVYGGTYGAMSAHVRSAGGEADATQVSRLSISITMGGGGAGDCYQDRPLRQVSATDQVRDNALAALPFSDSAIVCDATVMGVNYVATATAEVATNVRAMTPTLPNTSFGDSQANATVTSLVAG